MKKYRKKPIIIEAIQFLNGDGPNNIKECLSFVGVNALLEETEDGSCCMFIRTLEGDMALSNCDFIIKGINGEFYPCKPDIFEKTYEEVI